MVVKWIATIVVWGAYAVAFAPLHELTAGGGAQAALVLVPVALTGWVGGFGAGLTAALVATVLTAYLFGTVGSTGFSWREVVMQTVAVFFVGGLTGYAHDLKRRLQVRERESNVRARRDGLTGALNRRALVEEVEDVVSDPGRRAGLFYVDLDGFKAINDTFGHGVGDDVLKIVVDRFRTVLRRSDLVARVGGDEFVLVLPDLPDAARAAHLADQLVTSLQAPYELDGAQVRVTASIGVAMSPDDGRNLDVLMRSADTALYRVKHEGRNGFRLAEAHQDDLPGDAETLRVELRQALDRGELDLQFQPQVSLSSGRTGVFEALLRWRHPRRGLLPPSAFLPVAEAMRMSVPIGTWVLEVACRQAVAWRSGGDTRLRIAVNVSGTQFFDPDFVDTVRRALRASGLPPHALELEVTEATLIRDVDRAIGILRDLRRLGVALALDDFGTGVSSLTYLRRMPIDALKLDRSCVAALGEGAEGNVTMAVMRHVVDLAHTLGLRVVAEGVETGAELAAVRAVRCDCAQGDLFAAPRDAAEVARLLPSTEPYDLQRMATAGEP